MFRSGWKKMPCRHRVEKARKSNERIVFGFGHSSVAEHAVFNFDISGISRLAAEALQSFRLASFTEKSQRYVRLEGDWVTPPELGGTAAASYDGSAEELFGCYRELLEGLGRAGAGEAAGEDARYALPLCTSCQMGMTVNARELEHVVRRLRAWPLREVVDLAEGLSEAAAGVAPSLIRYTEPTAMDRLAARAALEPRRSRGADAKLLLAADDTAAGMQLAALASGIPVQAGRAAWRRMDAGMRRRLFEEILADLGPHDALPRIWEAAWFLFEVRLSSAAFAQLKRHRMATILPSAPGACGTTVPPAVSAAGLEGVLRRAAAVSGGASRLLPGPLSLYMTLNAHRRVILVGMNARELCRFSRLREDAHAQWDIRGLASRMIALARSRAPLTMAAAGGRSERS